MPESVEVIIAQIRTAIQVAESLPPPDLIDAGRAVLEASKHAVTKNPSKRNTTQLVMAALSHGPKRQIEISAWIVDTYKNELTPEDVARMNQRVLVCLSGHKDDLFLREGAEYKLREGAALSEAMRRSASAAHSTKEMIEAALHVRPMRAKEIVAWVLAEFKAEFTEDDIAKLPARLGVAVSSHKDTTLNEGRVWTIKGGPTVEPVGLNYAPAGPKPVEHLVQQAVERLKLAKSVVPSIYKTKAPKEVKSAQAKSKRLLDELVEATRILHPLRLQQEKLKDELDRLNDLKYQTFSEADQRPRETLLAQLAEVERQIKPLQARVVELRALV